MYKVGDHVVYGSHGVCHILDTEERRIDGKTRHFFVLEPLEQPGTKFYIPSQNPTALAKLRPVMTRLELDTLLSSREARSEGWIEDENQRKQRYRELIVSGDCAALIRMISSLHRHRAEQIAAGRKFHMCDENFLRDAEKILNAEFAFILGIAPSEVSAYVAAALQSE